ncbi:membrane protein [Lacticaseibacillus saniviri JCM 17471 = DSM 24301]|uniref:Membrane protein n=2 Tax=Lacticaseibacillus saniviri TaxID=931533 RepID=A0A0R2MZV2_9LACO|nr:membrane protein [Lacticaseibacillus saniviri JCM 17471 = DSM 24301]
MPDMLQGLYLNTALKLLMGFITFVVQIQLAGKGNLAPSTIVDQMQNFVLGGIIGGVIYNQDISLLQFFNVLLIWTLIVLSSKYLTNHHPLIKKWIDGTPVLVVHHGQVLVDNATKAGISANDLSYKLRTSGVADIREVERAILELNGQLTIVKRGDTSIKFPLVLDGQIAFDTLEDIHKDEDWLRRELAEQGYEPENVYMANYLDDRVVVAAYARGRSLPKK